MLMITMANGDGVHAACADDDGDDADGGGGDA